MPRTPRDFANLVRRRFLVRILPAHGAARLYPLPRLQRPSPRILVLFLGLVYFALGYFSYKYQLLYAMDQPQHATGGAWRIICYRILLGLGVFHLTMAGYLGANKAIVQAFLIIPLLLFTVWYSYYFRRRFEPLTMFISLRSIRRDDRREAGEGEDEASAGAGLASDLAGRSSQVLGMMRRGSTIDEDREKGLRFVNPSLVVPYVFPISPSPVHSTPPHCFSRHLALDQY